MISFVIFIAYILVYFLKYGVPKHISETYGQLGILFTSMLWVVSIDFGRVAFDLYPDYGWLSFLLVSSLMFIGASPLLDEDVEGKIHRVAATLAILLSVAWVLLVNPIGAVAYIMCGMCILGPWLFWLEVSCILSVYFAIFI